MVWFQFIACILVLFLAGDRLARYAHILSVRTKLGGLWIGLILVATITSVPETVAACSAAALFHNADLALSTLYGGNTYNLALIAMMDLLYRKAPVLQAVSRRQLPILFTSIILLALAGLGIAFGDRIDFQIGPVGLVSILLIVIYFGLLRRQQQSAKPDTDDSSAYLDYTLRRLAVRLAVAAAVVIASGVWLSYIGDTIATQTGLSSSFVGSLFLAISTSAPETIVTLAALRIGAIEMAVANLTGSVLYRSAIIILPDMFYSDGPILSAISAGNLYIIGAAIIMSSLVITGLLRPGRKIIRGIPGWYTLPIMGVYLLSFYLLFSA